jgi:HEAT repeat protein
MMKRLAISILLMSLAAAAAPAQQPDVPGALGFAASAADKREDELYRDGTDYVNDGKWQAASDKFAQVAKLAGTKADGALYWQAYAQNKLGQRAAAIETLAALQKTYPRSTWVKDAQALQVEIRSANGQASTPPPDADEELKIYAINGLMSMDPDQAFPLLQKVLTGNQPIKLKEKALFVLAQSGSPKASDLIAQIARGQAQPELQRKAIQQLGIRGNRELLGQIYASSTNPEAKKEVLRSLGICGGKQQLLEAAKNEKDFELKREAIRGLAIAGAREELRQLYPATADAETKRELIRSTNITGDQQGLLNIIQNERDMQLKREAVRTLGITGGEKVSPTLLNIYNSDKNVEIRRSVAQALFLHGDAHSLVQLSKSETDPELRKYLVQQLSLMGNNKEAADYLMQLLEK